MNGTSQGATERHKLLVLLCVSVPSFMMNLDSNIVAVSLPSIARSLHADFAAIEWVVSAYTLAFAALVMPAGMLADRYGRKTILLSGLTLFTLASFPCGAAPNIVTLNAARALQGLGAALQLSAALATLSHEFRGAERARAFAFWGSVIGVSITLGPVVGGIITQTWGWQWAFYINIPIGIAIIALTARTVVNSRDPHASQVDVPGSASFATALFLTTLALISGNHAGWLSRTVLIEFAIAVVMFALFIYVERVGTRPMLDLKFFRKPTYIGANIAGVIYAASLLTMFTYLPLYFQGGMGLTPRQAGMLMLPMAIPLIVVPRILSKYVTHRISGRALLTIGLSLVAFGLLCLALVSTSFLYAPMLVGMLIAGCGAGILNGETAKVSMTVIPPERAGMAAGVGGTTRFSGIVLGFATLGAVLFARVSYALREMLPAVDAPTRAAIAHRVVAGDLTNVESLMHGVQVAALAAFGAGYQAVFVAAGVVAGTAAAASWLLVRAADTPPVVHGAPASDVMVLMAE